MSVHKNRRGLSKMEFYHTARKLREDITNLLLRDFGVRDKVRKVKTDDHVEVTIIEEYPEWLIKAFRENMIIILRNLMMNITAGNTLYPVNIDEVRKRREYQDEAIINCEQLLQEMQYCADILPVKLEKFLPHVDSIELEIKLLKGWRKTSNDLEKNILNKGFKMADFEAVVLELWGNASFRRFLQGLVPKLIGFWNKINNKGVFCI